MEVESKGLRWGVERRLEFIDFRLLWEGTINRSDLTKQFGVSVPQASKDLTMYQELAPKNMGYDKSRKHYFATRTFHPRFEQADPDRYLAQLRSIAEHVVDPDETWISTLPDLGCMPVPHRRVEPAVLRNLLSSMRDRRAVEIHYQSMNPNRPDPQWRVISPHAFGHDGFRWHVRAFCHIDRKFKDFVLSRFLDVRDSAEPPAGPDDDRIWNEKIDIKLVPNPALSKSQREIIARDYSMDNDHLKISMRKALLYYFEKRLRLDVAKALDKPQEAPVVVANKAAFEKALAEAAA